MGVQYNLTPQKGGGGSLQLCNRERGEKGERGEKERERECVCV